MPSSRVPFRHAEWPEAPIVYDRDAEFNTIEFARSFVWEYFGMFFNMPFIFLLGGNRHVGSNRYFIPPFPFFFFVLGGFQQFLMAAAHVCYFLDIGRVQSKLSVWGFVLTHLLTLTRAGVVAVKVRGRAQTPNSVIQGTSR